ncbi:MAG: DUF1385 domain-containing protein [Ruthenibacterium sp.]
MAEQKNCTPCAFKTSVGGQALMEGIMMRGPKKLALAIRQPDGEIYTEVSDVVTHRWQKWPFIRGVFSFVDSMVNGYRCLMKSAEISMGEELEPESKFDKWIDAKFGDKGTNAIMAVAAVLGGGLALVLFMVLPTAIVGLINHFAPLGGFKTLVEGALKIAILIGYMAAVSKLPDIARMFSYHGAEHKTIACYEAGDALTVENVRRHRRFHPRCGTSFILIILVVSILLFSMLPWTNTGIRVVLKVLLLPLVMGISYEILKLCGRYDNWLTRIISAPGMWLQHITTNEPDDSMIECAIAAVQPVLPEKKEESAW